MHTTISLINKKGMGDKFSIAKGDNVHTAEAQKNGKRFSIFYHGELYNTQELKTKLANEKLNSDAEVVLAMYLKYGSKALLQLSGGFAFCVYSHKDNNMFLARDPIGLKSLFYHYKEDKFICSFNIRGILENYNIDAVLDKRGICEMLGLGPAKSPGQTIYKDIKEVKPGHSISIGNAEIKEKKYFNLKSKPHKDDVIQTAEKLKSKITQNIKNQLKGNLSTGVFLSGGIDSSLITSVAEKESRGELKAYSVDYTGNEENFLSSSFTPERDNYFINLLKDKLGLDHKYIMLSQQDLFDSLKASLDAREMPAMADIDASLLLLCNEIKSEVGACLSGEFADEIFCGYPWFYREDCNDIETFPWAIDLGLRKNILNKNLKDKIDIESFIKEQYSKALKEVPLMKNENPDDKKMKTYSYLTINYFGLNLIDRSDRISMASGLVIRVPFVDPELYQYVYNIPWQIKNHGGYEKGILRKAFEADLPATVAYRKKCPYPKTHDPKYSQLVEEAVRNIVADESKMIWQLIDIDFVRELVDKNDEEFSRPWFGQLMTRPQLLGFVYQIDIWLDLYKVKIEI